MNEDLWFSRQGTGYLKDDGQGSPKSGFIFQDPKTGEMEGNIYKLNRKNNLVGYQSLFKHVKTMIQNVAVCVGRIVCLYESEEDNHTMLFAGTGFAVTENIILTANHLVRDTYNTKQEGNYRLIKVYFTFVVDARWDSEVFFDDKDVFEVEKMPEIVSEIDEFKTTCFLGNEPWKIMNDFSFLKLKNYKSCNYLLPPLEKENPYKDCFIVGYPGSIGNELFIQDYFTETNDIDETYKENLQLLYDFVKESIDNFEKKIVTSGSCNLKNITKGFIEHQCPALRGFSGAPLTVLNPQTDCSQYFFSGIHVGGSFKTTNVAISASSSAFQIGYANAIKGETEFIDKHRNFLKLFFCGCQKLLRKYVPELHQNLFSDNE
ncbi:hypothetical protein ABK040_014349 [Willaertia magna]